LVVTRLLFEEAFGLMAIVQAVHQGLALFSDIGVGPAIVQSEREDPEFLNTAFTLQAVRGVILTILGIALGYPISVFYGQPELAYLLPFVSLTALAQGLNSTRVFTLTRNLSLGRLQVVEIVSQFAGVVAMVGWAWLHPSVWALAVGALVMSLVSVTLSHVFLPGVRNRFFWQWDAAVAQIRFGRWILVSTALTFLVGQTDRLVFGKLFKVATLGVYSIGMLIGTLPMMVVGQLSQKVIFPVFSQVYQRRGSLGEDFNQIRLPILLLGGWACSGLLAGGPTAVRLLYDERYLAAGWVIQAIAFSGWLLTASTTHGTSLLAMGKPRLVSLASGAKLVGLTVLITVGYSVGEMLPGGRAFEGSVLGFAFSEAARYAVTGLAVHREGLKPFLLDLQFSLFVGFTSFAGLCAARLVQGRGAGVVLEAAAVAGIVTALWLLRALPSLRTVTRGLKA